MASSTDFLPSREAELVTWTNNFNSKIVLAPTEYGLTAPLATAYDALNSTFLAAYTAANNPDTRSPTNIIAKNIAMNALKANARELAGIIQKYPGTTDVMREDLGLTVPSAPSPIPPPTVTPGVDLVSAVKRTVTIHIHDSASSSKRGKPIGAVAAYVYSFVGATYPSDPGEWDFQGASTRSTHQIIFPDTVPAGAQVWVCAAWINAKQESGPPSTPLTTNLQGGGVAMAA